MTYNYNKLKGRIIEKCGTQKEFAKAEQMSENSLTAKLQNKRTWTQEEIDKAVTILEIVPTEICEYFFCRES